MLAAADGAFAAEVDLTVDAEQPRGTIIVGYEDSGASVDSDRVIVTVGTPGVADPPKEAKSPEPSATPGARNVVVIGDSLAVGMQPYLQEFLRAGTSPSTPAPAARWRGHAPVSTPSPTRRTRPSTPSACSPTTARPT